MSKTVKTNDSNWRKLKKGEIKAEQIEITHQINAFEYLNSKEIKSGDTVKFKYYWKLIGDEKLRGKVFKGIVVKTYTDSSWAVVDWEHGKNQMIPLDRLEKI